MSLHSHPFPEYTWFHKNTQKTCIHTFFSNQNEQVPSPMATRWVGKRGCGAATLRGWGLPPVVSLPFLQVWKQMLLLFPEDHMARCHLCPQP